MKMQMIIPSAGMDSDALAERGLDLDLPSAVEFLKHIEAHAQNDKKISFKSFMYAKKKKLKCANTFFFSFYKTVSFTVNLLVIS